MAAFATSPYTNATRTDFPPLSCDDDGEFYNTGEGTSNVFIIRRSYATVTTTGTDDHYWYESEPEPPRLNRYLTKKLKKLERLYSCKKKIKVCLLIQTDPYLGFLIPKNLTFFTKKMRRIEKRSRANLRAGRRPPMVRYRLQKFCRGEK
jgi:hypothetical protein